MPDEPGENGSVLWQQDRVPLHRKYSVLEYKSYIFSNVMTVRLQSVALSFDRTYFVPISRTIKESEPSLRMSEGWIVYGIGRLLAFKYLTMM